MKDLRNAYRDALAVQCACNARAVVHSLERVLPIIVADTDGSTDAINRHPIMVLYIDKLASLSGCRAGTAFSEAYAIASEAVGATA